jgi:NAD(P)-dependent dehydrogenase (short-subunit alcohol dehydrogenase family)
MNLQPDLTGRCAIVVGGGGGGIGTSMVRALAQLGADVGAISYVEEHAVQTQADVTAEGRRCFTRVIDVTDEDALRTAMGDLIAELGEVRHLVNVVGGSLVDDWFKIEDLPSSAFDRILSRNLRYALVACQEVARPLLASGVPGSFVNISSISARGTSLLAAYGASKAGLESLSRTMALEWGPSGIRINLVAPGTIKTPRAGQDDLPEAVRSIPLRRRGTPDEIAQAAMFLLSDSAGYITGQTLIADGGTSIGPGGQNLPSAVTNPLVIERFA